MALKAGRVGVDPSQVDSSGMIAGNVGAYTKAETNSLLSAKADKSTTYAKTEVNNLFLDILPDLFDSAPDVSAEGNPLIINDVNVEGNADGCVLYFTPKQSGSGTPSPTNVRTISGSDSATITVKNSDNTTTETVSRSYASTLYGGTDDVTGTGVTEEYEMITPTSVASVSQSGGIYYWLVTTNLHSINGANVLSSHFESRNAFEPGCCYASNVGAHLIAIPTDQTLNTKTLADAWMAANNPQFLAKLATPSTVSMSPDNVALNKGYNKAETTADKVKLTYKADVYKYIERKLGITSGTRTLSAPLNREEIIPEIIEEPVVEKKTTRKKKED